MLYCHRSLIGRNHRSVHILQNEIIIFDVGNLK